MQNNMIIASEILKIQFYTLSSQKLIDSICLSKKSNFQVSELIQYLRHKITQYSEHTLNNLICAFLSQIKDCRNSTESSLYDVLFWFASNIITYKNDRFLFHYQYADIWRSFVTDMDEELVVTAAVVRNDKLRNHKRIRYDWNLCIEHDNFILLNILNRDDGVSENHFHLRGSSSYASLSWLYLMNNVKKPEYKVYLREIELNRLKTNCHVPNEQMDVSLRLMWKRSALIRVYLYCFCENIFVDFGQYSISLETFDDDFSDAIGEEKIAYNRFRKNIKNHNVFLNDVKDLYYHRMRKKYEQYWRKCTYEALIDILSIDDEKMFPVRRVQRVIDELHMSTHTIDYVKPNVNIRMPRYEDILGERYLICRILQYVEIDDCIAQLLHVYLLMKNKIRNELVQSNQVKGFVNFQKYQNRKDYFIQPWNIKKEKRMTCATIESILNGPKMFRIELRICPENNVADLKKMIKLYDSAIDEALNNLHQVLYSLKGNIKDESFKYCKDQFFYTLHFIKSDDTNKLLEDACLKCRHYSLRKIIKRQMYAILQLQKKYPEIAKRVRGIDACNDEMNCRPEVFASVFRQLLLSPPNENLSMYVKSMKATYHVAEDNYDIIDGLRAIDEAIRFLGLYSGCRLGHATLLGIDVKKYYEKFNYHVSMPKQVFLDNMVWMYYFLQENDIYFDGDNTVKSFLYAKATALFEEIYLNNIFSKDIEYILNKQGINQVKERYNFDLLSYYKSWKLRGDDPHLYIMGYFKFPNFPQYEMNDLDFSLQEIRSRVEPVYLYHMYHYNPEVKAMGSVSISEKIPEIIINAIQIIQKCMQKKVLYHGISIETNPSSNLFINNIGDYSEHPIVHFYNRDMKNESDEIQLNVSINTDDKTIFSTNLSNEYALLAFYLEQKKDESGNPVFQKYMIYDWIDAIRKMGNEQSFGYDIDQDYPC